VSGRFIAFEGGEGTGKSTQAARLARRLGAVLTHEPGGTDLGQAVRRLLLDAHDLDVTPRAEALLMAADRGSSIAYQGYGRQLDPQEIASLSAWATDELRPDLVLLLVVPPSVAVRRTGGARDKLEAAGADFHQRVHQGFLTQAIADPERWAVIDGTLPEDEVAQVIWDVITVRFPDLT
jgi:dTMP kinase